MNYVEINGIEFDATVAITEGGIEESFNVLHGDNVGRVKSGAMVFDPIGTYIGHKITFFNAKSPSNGKTTESFDALWDFLIAHSLDMDGVSLKAADGQSAIQYQAYYSSGTRRLKTVSDGVNQWDELEVNFIPIKPQVTP